MCQQTPMRCCFDMISQTFIGPTARLAGRTAVKWQVCHLMGEPKGVGHSHPLGPSRTAAARCQFAVALTTFLLESQQDFYFLSDTFLLPQPQLSGPGLAVCPCPRCVDQHLDRAQAAVVRPLLPLAAPPSVLLPHGTPGRSRQSWARITGGR